MEPVVLSRPELTRLIRFAMVGGTGFLIDAGLLAMLHHAFSVDPFTARLVSISASALTTWRLNRIVTFGESDGSQAAEGLRYALVAALAAGLNYGLYAVTLLFRPEWPPVTVAIGATLVAMFFSYAGYSRFAFQRERPAVLAPPMSHKR